MPSTRFTPTGVGTIPRPRRVIRNTTVHPHGRGDNRSTHTVMSMTRGSPPRAWGQCGGAPSRPPKARFTPTGVGTIYLPIIALAHIQVHPHGRGDNHGRDITIIERDGSPPRAWGQLAIRFGPVCMARFTPTGVGTIPARAAPAHTRSVHPHGRGDNRAVLLTDFVGDGSPPRAWGQSVHWYDVPQKERFTPTGVGTITSDCATPQPTPVHPHGRGDN